MVDEKRCYLFGRNPDVCDFCIDHASCSRVHSALVYHKHLQRSFLIDLGSTHGTFIGSMKLDSNKPTQIPIDCSFHFGASTRTYILRERPQTAPAPVSDDKERTGEEIEGGLLGLPETETELDNLTEFNTAHNRRVTSFGIPDDNEVRPANLKRKRKNLAVKFSEDEEIINPEDIDPSVGRFRNMIQTAIIPTKKRRMEGSQNSANPSMTETITKRLQNFPYKADLYSDIPAINDSLQPNNPTAPSIPNTFTTKLGIGLVPNPAPEVELSPPSLTIQQPPANVQAENVPQEPKKKKYAKEAWPGRKPTPSFLV